jgi:hypothetical protein
MKSLQEKIKKAMKWKKSISYMAIKFEVSEEKVKEIISSIREERKNTFQGITESKVDLQKNTQEIKGVSLSEPKTPEEIIKLLKIDTSKWRLSNYWNKQQGNRWVISALVTQKTLSKEEILTECLSSFNPEYIPLKKEDIHINKEGEEVCAVISMQDLHFGKLGNENVKDRVKQALSRLTYSLHNSYKVDKIIFVLGGDLINMDTFNNTGPLLKENIDDQRMKIDIAGIPYNKWVNVMIRAQNRILDVYVNGVLTQHKDLGYVPKQNFGDVYVCQNGGFSGKLSDLRYYAKSLNVFEINGIVGWGPSLSTSPSASGQSDTDASYLSYLWYKATQ